ncbi:MAG: WG repeat-containing protein, partial [Rhodanobacter sp.]
MPAPQLIPICVSVFESQCGLLDRHGHWVVEPSYDAVYARRDGWVVTTHTKDGWLEADGRLMFEPRFDSVGEFEHGLASASLGRKYGYIDRQGHWVIPAQYFLAGDFADGIAVVGHWIGSPNGGHSRMAYIGPDGKPAFPGAWKNADAFHFGMAAVDRGPSVRTASNIDQASMALIDRQGRQLMDWRKAYRLTPLSSDRVLESTADHEALLDKHGKVLFSVPHEGDLVDAGDGRLNYRETYPGNFGLLDIQTVEVLVAPSQGWTSDVSFSDGVAWVMVPNVRSEVQYKLIGPRGETLLERADYKLVEEFFGGAAPVSRDGKTWQLINRLGKPLTDASYSSMDPAWNWGPQSPRLGDVWRAKQVGAPASTDWVDAQGHIVASVSKLACGIEVVRNPQHEVIWPRDVEAHCAVAESEHTPARVATSAAPIDPARVAAVRLTRARRSVQRMDRTREFFATNGDRQPADTLTTQQKILQAPWQRGPAVVTLGPVATLSLPAGYRYLSPEYIPALRSLLGGALASVADQPGLPLALLANDDLSIVLRIAEVKPGHVGWDGLPLDAASLKKRMEINVSGFARAAYRDNGQHLIEWMRAPQFEATAHRMDWSFNDFQVSGVSYERTYYVNSVLLGRQSLVALQGVASGLAAEDYALVMEAAMDEISVNVHFAPGHQYSDASAAEVAAGLDITAFITGAPLSAVAPVESTERQAEGGLAKWWLLALLGVGSGW